MPIHRQARDENRRGREIKRRVQFMELFRQRIRCSTDAHSAMFTLARRVCDVPEVHYTPKMVAQRRNTLPVLHKPAEVVASWLKMPV